MSPSPSAEPSFPGIDFLSSIACNLTTVLPLHPRAHQQLPFLGGRLAIRRALHDRGNSNIANTANTPAATSSDAGVAAPVHTSSTCGAILHDDAGAPLLPDGMSASISHKRHIAVALVQKPGARGHLGACSTMSGVPTPTVYSTVGMEPLRVPGSLEIP